MSRLSFFKKEGVYVVQETVGHQASDTSGTRDLRVRELETTVRDESLQLRVAA
jgi:hypothetical protein